MTRSGSSPDDDLPPVEVDVPDDARELDADVLAYYREQHERFPGHDQVGAPERVGWWRFARILPFVLAALMVAVVTAGTLTLLGPRPSVRPPASELADRPTAAPGDVGGLLPDATVMSQGRERPVRDLRPAVLAVVGPECGCAEALRSVHLQASEFELRMYLVAPPEDASAVRRLASHAGLGTVSTVVDTHRQVVPAYTDGAPTYVLVHADGVVREILTDVSPADRLELHLAPLSDPGVRG
ncbi:MAG: hypothetical protein ACRDYU_16305 [Actinomycetes bacterium]